MKVSDIENVFGVKLRESDKHGTYSDYQERKKEYMKALHENKMIKPAENKGYPELTGEIRFCPLCEKNYNVYEGWIPHECNDCASKASDEIIKDNLK